MNDINDSVRGRTLSKYMRLEYFEDLLNNMRVTLVNPDLWPDINDSKTLEHYKHKNGHRTLRAACFTQAAETSHHWSVYGQNDGARVIFNRVMLLNAATKNEGFITDDVEYIRLKEFKNKVTEVSQLPFVKRWAFRDEREYRIIWTGSNLKGEFKYLKIPEAAIEKVIFGPSVSAKNFEKMCQAINNKFKVPPVFKKSSVLHCKSWLQKVSKIDGDSGVGPS